MVKVELDAEEWQRVMAIIANAPWSTANPLLMKIGEQLRRQPPVDPAHPATERPMGGPKAVEH